MGRVGGVGEAELQRLQQVPLACKHCLPQCAGKHTSCEQRAGGARSPVVLDAPQRGQDVVHASLAVTELGREQQARTGNCKSSIGLSKCRWPPACSPTSASNKGHVPLVAARWTTIWATHAAANGTSSTAAQSLIRSHAKALWAASWSSDTSLSMAE
jgi:hypothetical protein